MQLIWLDPHLNQMPQPSVQDKQTGKDVYMNGGCRILINLTPSTAGNTRNFMIEERLRGQTTVKADLEDNIIFLNDKAAGSQRVREGADHSAAALDSSATASEDHC